METGLKTALGEAQAEFEEEAEPVQAFLPLLPADAVAGLPQEPAARRASIAAAAPRQAGRPKGAKNKSTEAFRRLFLSKYQSPLIVLAEVYSRPVADLAAELGCTKLEAFDRQVKAADAVAPFIHGKMPVEVAVTGDLPTLVLADPATFAAAFGNVENQALNLLDLTPVGQPEFDNAPESEEIRASRDGAPLIADQQAEASRDAAPGEEGDR